jgi:hypothetical protein
VAPRKCRNFQARWGLFQHFIFQGQTVIIQRLLAVLTVFALPALGGSALAQGAPGAGGLPPVIEVDWCKARHDRVQQNVEKQRARLNAAVAARDGVTWQQKCDRSRAYFDALSLLARHIRENQSACDIPGAAAEAVKELQGRSHQKAMEICRRAGDERSQKRL